MSADRRAGHPRRPTFSPAWAASPSSRRSARRCRRRASVYLCDNAFFPYGTRPDAELLAHFLEVMNRGDRSRAARLDRHRLQHHQHHLPAAIARRDQHPGGRRGAGGEAGGAEEQAQDHRPAGDARHDRPPLHRRSDPAFAAGCTRAEASGRRSWWTMAEAKLLGQPVDPRAAAAASWRRSSIARGRAARCRRAGLHAFPAVARGAAGGRPGGCRLDQFRYRGRAARDRGAAAAAWRGHASDLALTSASHGPALQTRLAQFGFATVETLA